MKKDYFFYFGTAIATLNILTTLYFIIFTPTDYLVGYVPRQLFNWLFAYIPTFLTIIAVIIMTRDFKILGIKNWRALALESLTLFPTTLFFALSIVFGGPPIDSKKVSKEE